MAIIDLSRNFGKEIALTAGLDYAQGDAVVVLDADLQDPPGLIPDLMNRWKNSYDVVYGKREKKQGESFVKKATAYFFYGREAGHQKVQCLIAVAMLMLALLFASIGVEVEHWGWELSRLVPVGGSLLLLLTAIAAQAPMAAIFSILFISASAGDSMHLALASSTSLFGSLFLA